MFSFLHAVFHVITCIANLTAVIANHFMFCKSCSVNRYMFAYSLCLEYMFCLNNVLSHGDYHPSVDMIYRYELISVIASISSFASQILKQCVKLLKLILEPVIAHGKATGNVGSALPWLVIHGHRFIAHCLAMWLYWPPFITVAASFEAVFFIAGWTNPAMKTVYGIQHSVNHPATFGLTRANILTRVRTSWVRVIGYKRKGMGNFDSFACYLVTHMDNTFSPFRVSLIIFFLLFGFERLVDKVVWTANTSCAHPCFPLYKTS